MDDRPFGARFIDEMRRLTRPSWGLEYREMQRLGQMDEAQFRAAFGNRVASSEPPASGPEGLARAIVEQGRSPDVLRDLVSILGGLV